MEVETLPKGAHANDFRDLDNRTLRELLTLEGLNEEDRKNVQREIDFRRKAGSFSLKGEHPDPRKDFLLNGYGIQNGEVLYPTAEYKEYIENGAEGPLPKEERETLKERLNGDDEKSVAEKTETTKRVETGSKIAESEEKNGEQKPTKPQDSDYYIEDWYDSNESTVERMRSRYGENPKEGQRRVQEKNNQNQVNKTEMHNVEENRFSVYPTPEKAAADALTKELYESGYLPEPKPLRSGEFSEKRQNVALETVNEKLNEYSEEYFKESAIKGLSHGDFVVYPKQFITDSLMDNEGKIIDSMMAKKERAKFWNGAGAEAIERTADDYNYIKAGELMHDAVIEAIARGAYIERVGVGKTELRPTIPIGIHSDERIRDFIKYYDVDIKSDEVRLASYDGFANIIEKIVEQEIKDAKGKDAGKATADGFKALDWYFETFGYGKQSGIHDFFNAMDGYQEEASLSWLNKFEEYKVYLRSEKGIDLDHILQEDAEKIPTLQGVVDVDSDALMKAWEEAMNEPGDDDDSSVWDRMMKKYAIFAIPEIFKDKQLFPKGPGSGAGNRSKYVPQFLNKFNGFMNNYAKIKMQHPNAKLQAAMFVDSYKRLVPHLVTYYEQNGSSVAIVAPIEENYSAATYCLISKGEQRLKPQDWTLVFSFDPANPNKTISKLAARHRPDVRPFNHIGAPKQGRSPVENMWYNILNYINRVA